MEDEIQKLLSDFDELTKGREEALSRLAAFEATGPFVGSEMHYCKLPDGRFQVMDILGCPLVSDDHLSEMKKSKWMNKNLSMDAITQLGELYKIETLTETAWSGAPGSAAPGFIVPAARNGVKKTNLF